MANLEEKVVAVEKLSQQLVASNKTALAGASAADNAAPCVGVVSVVQMDFETVDLAITGILAIAGKIQSVSQLVGGNNVSLLIF